MVVVGRLRGVAVLHASVVNDRVNGIWLREVCPVLRMGDGPIKKSS